MVLRNPDGAPSVEDLAVGINAVSSSIETGRARRAAAVRRVRVRGRQQRKVYFIYNYKRGYWYPFVPDPTGAKERSTERELQIKAQMASELPIEPELERWFPLWGYRSDSGCSARTAVRSNIPPSCLLSVHRGPGAPCAAATPGARARWLTSRAPSPGSGPRR